MKRCQAKITTGDQCRNNAIRGTDYCYLRSHCAGCISWCRRAQNFISNKKYLISLILALLIFITGITIDYYMRKKQAFYGIINTKDIACKKTLAIGGIRIILETFILSRRLLSALKIGVYCNTIVPRSRME